MPVKEIIVLASLPGCGAEEWVEKQVMALGSSSMSVLGPSKDGDAWKSVQDSHDYVFVSDPYFCLFTPETIQRKLENNLNRALVGVSLRWACLENNLEIALSRNPEKTHPIIKKLSSSFRVPDLVKVMPINGRQSPWWTIPVFCTFPDSGFKEASVSATNPTNPKPPKPAQNPFAIRRDL